MEESLKSYFRAITDLWFNYKCLIHFSPLNNIKIHKLLIRKIENKLNSAKSITLIADIWSSITLADYMSVWSDPLLFFLFVFCFLFYSLVLFVIFVLLVFLLIKFFFPTNHACLTFHWWVGESTLLSWFKHLSGEGECHVSLQRDIYIT